MLHIAQLSNADVAAIAAFSSMMTAVIASGVAWWNGHHKNTVDENASLFNAYNDVVQNLQTEITRLQNELSLIRDEMHRCETSNQKLTEEIQDLKRCIDKLTNETERIDAVLTAEYPPSSAETL
jgi:peptidoglycan hydrolase CwlO-like protein